MKKDKREHICGFQRNNENKIYRYRANRNKRLLKFRESLIVSNSNKTTKRNNSEARTFNTLRYTLPKKSIFYNNEENFSLVINDILNKLKPFNRNQILILDLSEVTDIDHYAVLVLLTLVNYLNIKNVTVSGNIPKNSYALKILEESGFFSWVNTGHKFIKKGEDLIYTIGKNSADQNSYADCIYNIMKHLTGISQKYQPLYTVLGEIQINSIEHSNKKGDAPNWFMSVHYEQDKCIITMADIGKGIVNTLNLLFTQRTMRIIKGFGHGEILLNLFKGKYQSSTREPNRNNGLPDIYSIVKDNKITNLSVISNKGCVFLPQDRAGNLKINFPGTFYRIEISKHTIDRWITRNTYTEG